jgi:Tail tubular protein
MIITPQTELDAVNEILSTIGSMPVNTLDEQQDVDTINAQRILKGVSREVQSRGWYFNTLTSYTLTPDAYSDLIPYPNSYLKVFADGYQLVRKSGYFFDLTENTNEFPSGLTVDELVKEIDFENLPEAFRYYVTVKAARIFQARYLTSQEIDKHLQMEEAEAYTQIIDFDLQSANYNIFDDDQTISQNIQRS